MNLLKLLRNSFLISIATSCGSGVDILTDDNHSPNTPTNDLPSSLELNYLDAKNSDALVLMSDSSTFPLTTADTNAGYLNIRGNILTTCPGSPRGQTINYSFQLKNTGTGTLTSSYSPVAIINKTSNYGGAPHTGTSSDFQFNITQAPTLPLPPGQSTTMVVTFTNTNNTSCALGMVDGFDTKETARLTIRTNDPDHANYILDLNVFGNS